jgi:very-short-patch-repair endonuclease
MPTIWIVIILIAVIVVILEAIFKKGTSQKDKSLYNYKRKDFLMSKAEHELFDILVEILGNEFYVFPQIHLSTILDENIVGQNWNVARRHIDEKSVDYVICDKVYIKPLLAIELDDKTHDRKDRIERDSEVERMLDGASFPLLRLRDYKNLSKDEIKKSVLEKI